jgi:hypothetical protein
VFMGSLTTHALVDATNVQKVTRIAISGHPSNDEVKFQA